MSAWIVYSKDGQTERCKLKKLEYSGSFMNERTVTATFEYHSEVAFEVFDYIVYRGEKFELEAIPSVKKTSSMDYQYELRFVSLKYELERCEMRDIVPNDNGITYPTPLTFSFTGDVRYLTERIQANLDALYGQGVWSIVVSDDVESEEKNITIAQQNCWNALSLINTTYGLNFSIKGRVVTIGGNQSTIGHTFQYGKGNGLYEIERNSDTDTGIVTKLRAYGGTRNLDYSYPKKPEWADSVLPVSFILSPLRLMLPSFKEDGKTDYILADEATISEYGIREASVIYDDIYPSITGATNSRGQKIDEIMSVEPIDDSASTFVVYLHNLEFDLESQLMTDNAQISMKSGAMQGYTFNISEIERISNNFYKITLGRITTDESDTGNYDIPNSSWHMEAGDKFVFLNILMPQKYIRDAEQRLLKRAQEYLAEYGKTNFSYNVGLHDKFLKEHEDIYNELIEGAKLNVFDSELGISENITIQSITITEYADDNILPQVKVTLNNKPSASTLERIQGQIKELSETSAGQFSTQSELLKQYRRKLDKPFFDRLFAAVDFDGNEIPSTDMTTPIAYIKARFNFATLGGVTMYLDDKSLNLPSIYDGLPIDHDTIYWENGILKAKGGSSVDEGAVKEIIESYDYATEDFVKEYVLQNATGGEFELSKQMVIEALGFTPYSASNPNGYITAASIPSALKNPYALTFGSKTYDGSAAKEITASDLGAALSSDLAKYLPLTGGTVNGIVNLNYNLGASSYIRLTNNRTRESSGWAVSMYDFRNHENVSMAGLGAFGGANTLSYLHLGHYGYDGNNLRVYSNKVTFGDNTIWHAGNDGSGSGLDADLLDGTHESSFVKKVGRYSIHTADVAPYNYIHLFRIGVSSAWSSHYVDFSVKTRHSSCDFYLRITTQNVAYGSGKSEMVIRKDKKYDRDIDLYYKETINSSGYNYYDVYMSLRSNWSDGQYDIISNGGSGTLVFEDKRIYLDSLPSGYVTVNSTSVSYANALSTARTIWGQSFDGTGDVTGCLHINFKSYNGDYTQGLRINAWDGVSSIFLNTTNASGYDNGMWAITANVNGNLRFRGGATSLSDFLVVTQGGNVGIGTTSPSAKLHVYGGANPIMCESTAEESSIYFVGNGSGSAYKWAVGKGVWGLSGKFGIGEYNTKKALYMQIGIDGNVGIGVPYTANPSAKLHVVGNILATGGVTMQSQRSLKNVVDERGLSLAELSAITPTRFTWKDKRDDRLHFGGIADDIEKVLPEVIYKTADGTLTMDYGNAGFAIASSLIKPVIDHETKIIDHDTEIRMLKIRVKELEEELKRYSA